MKLISRLVIVCLMLVMLAVPVTSYAIVDASLFGGYSFNGELSQSGSKFDTDGWVYGGYAHFNTGIPALFKIGLGGFYQALKLDVESNPSIDRNIYGVDIYAQLKLPVLPVEPYIRFGLGIYDQIKIDSTTYSKYFNSNYYGVGVAYTVFSAAVIDLQIFAEYLYNTAKQEDDIKMTGNIVNLGIKLSI